MPEAVKTGFVAGVKTFLEVVASLAVIAGVPLFLIQQQTEVRAGQVASALEFVKLHNVGQIGDVRAKVSRPWADIDVGAFARQHPSPAAIIKMERDVMASSNVTRSDLMQLTDFYNSVLSCRNRDICDKTAIDIAFAEPIAGLYCTYQASLADIARSLNSPHYLDDIRAYVGSCDAR